MGLFGKKQQVEKAQDAQSTVGLSSDQLKQVLDRMVLSVEEQINTGSYLFGSEIMFDYEGETHFIGAKYDKKVAKKAHVQGFSPSYAYVYIDKQQYPNAAELFANAQINGTALNAISCGMIAFRDEVEELLPQ